MGNGSMKTLHTPVHLPPNAMEAIENAPPAHVGGVCAVEAAFGYQRPAPSTILTDKQREIIETEVAAQMPHWHTFKSLAPAAFEQTKMRVMSDTYQIRCLNGSVQDYNIIYNPTFASRHESGFSLRWIECSFMCVEQNNSLNKKRVDDRFASLVANIVRPPYLVWH